MKRSYCTSSVNGFTLIAVVVSMFLLAVLSVMAWQGMELVLNANTRSETDLAAEMRLQRTWQLMGNDMIHLRARPYADGLGGIEPAYQTGVTEVILRFTRGGEASTATNPAGLSRIQYVLEGDALYRISRPAQVSPRDVEASRRLLLEGVSELQFEQLDRENYYVPFWPPLNEDRGLESLPPMIRITLAMADGSTTSQIFPGVNNDLL
jgi:general secretion pathway protein J